MAVIDPPENKLANRPSVNWVKKRTGQFLIVIRRRHVKILKRHSLSLSAEL